MDYQAIFDQTFPTFDDEEKYGRYGQLVYTLEAVFKAAGYDITGAELAGDHHNQICGAIGQTKLADIARQFIGWIRIDDHLDYRVRAVVEVRVPYNLYDVRRQPQISLNILKGWDDDIKRSRQKRAINGCKSKKAQAFYAEVAATPRVRETMLNTAQALIDDRARQLDQIRAEIEEENGAALGRAGYLRRTAHIIDAFGAVSGVEDSQNKADALRDKAAAIERGTELRQQNFGTDDDNLRAVEVIAANLTQSNRLVELLNVWRLIYADLLVEYLNKIYAVNGNRFSVAEMVTVGEHIAFPVTYGDIGFTEVAPEKLAAFADGYRHGHLPEFRVDGESVEAVRLHSQNVTYVIKFAGGLLNPWADAAAFMTDLVEAGY